MNIQCYIVDDMKFVIELIQFYITQVEDLELVGSATDPIEAKTLIGSGSVPVDVVFMDVEMPDLSGIELAMILKGKMEIVFTTAHRTYAADAYELDAADYLVKPFSLERFKLAIERVKARIHVKEKGEEEKEVPYIFLPGNGKNNLIKVYFEDIRYIRASSNYMEIHTDKKTLLCYISTTKILNMLPSSRFIRVHKSYIVNLDKADQIESSSILLENGDEIPIGGLFKDALMKKIKRY